MVDDIRIDMKPMSVNRAWQGKRYKSDEYQAYQAEMLCKLPAGKIPEPPYRISFEFGFSRRECDWDNPVKPTQDILAKKYGFDDKDIYEASVKKVIVKKGHEYVRVRIEHIFAE